MTVPLHSEQIFQLHAKVPPSAFSPPGSQTTLNNLPTQVSSFIGREAELAAVRALVSGSRLVTLTGAGGAGKTRLGLQVAAGLASGCGDGVWFVDLAPLGDPELVAVTVANALGVRVEPSRPVLDAVVAAVGGRSLLVLLDNCEHVIGACAKLADALLQGCPNLAMLATSREPLGIAGEHVYRVPSLAVPADGADVAAIWASEAVRLLADRAAAGGVPLAGNEESARVAGRICRRLDGIPLALELAAARLRGMNAAELEARLDHRFDVLTAGSRAGLPRQQTLRAMVDWSWELLNPAERVVLARLSTFAGGFGLAAAEAVAAGPDVLAAEVAGMVGALVDKGLVQFDHAERGPSRYRLLETIRQYAAGQLDALGPAAVRAARMAHRDYYLALAEEAAPQLRAADQAAWLDRLDAELGNLRTAIAFSLSQPDPEPGLRLAASLRAYWPARGHATEAADALQTLLDLPASGEAMLTRARALAAATNLADRAGSYATAGDYCEEALAIARAAGDDYLVADLLYERAWVLLHQGQPGAALPLIESGLDLAGRLGELHLSARLLNARSYAMNAEGDHARGARDAGEALRLFRQSGDKIQMGTMLGNLGYFELAAGDLDAARGHLAESLDIARALNARDDIVYETFNLGLAEYLGGSPGVAEALFAETLDLTIRTGLKRMIAYALIGLALTSRDGTDPGRPARLHGAADQALADQNRSLEPLEARLVGLDRQRLRAAMGAEAFDADYASGRGLDPAGVLAELGRPGIAAGRARIAGPGEAVAAASTDGVLPRPDLLGRLGGPARVTVVCAPAGSGKTVLLQSWISQAGLAECAAWVAAGRDEGDPQPFWLSVVAAMRRTAAGSVLVRAVSAAPDLDGWAVTERLLADLAPLQDRMWLVVDDAHELGPDALRQLELLIMRAPAGLRFVLATRHDVRLGLHRLRVEGELAEIREPDLRFTMAEAEELLAAAGVELPGPGLALVYERTEGWAAGLRLAALSLAGHDDPARFAKEFCGSERTVAEYLLAEVLDQQGEEVRRLLLRTSILERINGELADLLTGGSGGERVLQDLAAADAFVLAVEADRSWFRYHHLFADLLQLELRRTVPGEVAGLHRAAAGWLAGHGYPVEAVRHAQAARDWDLAVRLLTDHWPGLYLDGQDAVLHELLAGFPAETQAADAALAAVAAVDELARGSVETAEWYLGLAERGSASVPDGRRRQSQVLFGIVRLLLDHQRGDLPAVAEDAKQLLAMAEAADTAQCDLAPAGRAGLGEELRALALISLGSTEVWAGRFEDAEPHLEQGVALARRIGRPFLEFTGLAYYAAVEDYLSSARAAERSRQAIGLAERHGWTDEPAFGVACMVLGAGLVGQGKLEEAEPWVLRAERTLRAETHPAARDVIRDVRGMLELARGRDADALAAFEAAERLNQGLAAPHYLVPRTRALLLHALARLGQTERAEQALAELAEHDRDHGEVRIATAALRLAHDDPQAATAALEPVLDGPVPVNWQTWLAQAYVLEAIARDALGDTRAAESALERALDLAEPNGTVLPFLLHPAPGLLQRHAGQRTAHAALIVDILSLLVGQAPAPPARPRPLLEALSDSEIRVLRYLPTNLTGPEIAGELYVSLNTVKTHMRSLYAKLGTHRRGEAVARARALGLLAPSPHRRQGLPSDVDH
jgi:LuxR family transcriptional regulator, maltose regulon positive regulatory protein